MRMIWQGTDSLLLVKMPRQLTLMDRWYAIKLRLFARLADRLASEHYCCGFLVERNLREFGVKKPILQHQTPVNTLLSVDKKEHEDFNILYYLPKKPTAFQRWIYGFKVVEEFMSKIEQETEGDVNLIVVDGSADMKEVYPIIDFMIRPNNHDGNARMVRECELNNIPYYWSRENPNLYSLLAKFYAVNNNRPQKK